MGQKNDARASWTPAKVIVTILLLVVSTLVLTTRFAIPTSITSNLSSIGPAHGLSFNSRPSEDVVAVRTQWHAPSPSELDDLSTVLNSTGVYGFVYNTSDTPESLAYPTYNWCNMPHVRAQEYIRPEPSYELVYVEVVHRHHKRTPYLANSFPRESYPWYCSDEGLVHSAATLPVNDSAASANTYWKVYTPESNPLHAGGFAGDCRFPQITAGGLADSRQHGRDLRSVYVDLLGFLPSEYDADLMTFRVTNNEITSQVASELLPGFYPELAGQYIPLLVQPTSIDSLEPGYPCPASTSLYRSYAAGSTSGRWKDHLSASTDLFKTLDTISGIPRDLKDWHISWDHYYDNLSSRLCHNLPLPCSLHNTSHCVTQRDADTVFRLGQWEYGFTYRTAGPKTLDAAVASFGIWMTELAANLRAAAGGTVRYRHNVAHDGSVARLLSVLQIERMVWPGMGAEVVFEVYTAPTGGEVVRVLWGGEVLVSSHKLLGRMDMLPLETVVGYLEGLVGRGGVKVPELCNGRG